MDALVEGLQQLGSKVLIFLAGLALGAVLWRKRKNKRKR